MLDMNNVAKAIDIIYTTNVRRHIIARITIAIGVFITVVGIIFETSDFKEE